MTIYMTIDPDHMLDSYNDLVLQFNKVTKEKLDLEGKYEILQHKYTNLEDLSTELVKTNNLLNRGVVEVSNHVENLEREYDELNKKYQALLIENSSVKIHKDRLVTHSENLHKTWKEAHKRLEEKYVLLEKTYYDLDEKYLILLKADNDAKSSDQKTSEDLIWYRDYINSLNTELDREIALRKKATADLQICESLLKTRDTRYTELSKAYDLLKKDYETIKCYRSKTYTDLTNEYTDLNDEWSKKYKTLLNDYDNTKSFNNALVRDLKKENNELNEKYQTLLDDCESVKCNSLTEENKKLKNELTRMNEITARAQSLSYKNHDLEQKLKEMEKAYQSKQTEKDELGKRALEAEQNYHEVVSSVQNIMSHIIGNI